MAKEKKYWRIFLIGALLLIGLFVVSLYNYLLFHALAEIFSVAIAFGIFMLAWNSRSLARNSYLLFIGIAYLFIGFLDLIHTLAYKGMGVFPEYGANLSTQLWIAARYLESVSLLIGPFLIGRKLKAGFPFIGYTLLIIIFLASIFYWDIFPTCYIEGQGLTSFKKVSEYIISFLLLTSILVLFLKRHNFEKAVLRLLIASIIVTIASELTFTFYTDVYGLFNLIGHYLKIASFYLIYKAIVEIGLSKPYALFFRSQKKEREEQLRDLEAQFAALMGSTTDMICSRDKEGALIVWNKAFGDSIRHSFGIEPYVGLKTWNLISPEQQKKLTHVQEAYRKVYSGENSFVEYEYEMPNGQMHFFESLWSPILKEKELVAIAEITRDITDRKRSEEEVNQLREEYLHISRVATIGELAASLAHELKQPLAAIRSNAQAAQRFLTGENPDLDEFHEILADIIKDDRRADEVIGRLRSLMHKGDLQIAELNINEIVKEILPLIRSYEIMRNISIEFELSDKVPSIAGDRVQLQQVILNLLLNSSEALTDVTGDMRKIIVQTSQKDKENVTVAIKDNGPGIDEQAQDRLFEPFYTTKKEGMGMGLAISRSIIEAHRGCLWVENNPDRGATFYFTLPVFKGSLT